MKLEKLEDNTSKVKGVIIGILLTIWLVILINYITSLARYRNTESIELASGNISYNKADLNIIAMYQEKDDSTKEEKEYVSINKIPTSGYKLSSQSYCEVGNQKVEEAEIIYDGQYIGVNKLSEKGTKCYIYFDSLVKEMLGKLETSKRSKYTIDAMPSPITGMYDEQKENPEHKEKLYTSPDNYGTSYVFRGNNDDVNNWVTFANHTWRIIRINGDGTLRLIYQCATPNCQTTEGEETQIGKSAYKSEPYDDNAYVGYYYGTAHSDEKPNPSYEETHSNATASNIATAVDNWYTGTGTMNTYTEYIDGSTGWCNDRTLVKGIWNGFEGNGTGQSASGYAPASRLVAKGGAWRKNQYLTLKCGVVTPDEDPTEEEGFSSFDEIDPTAFKRDLFTTKNSGRGNEVLTNPVGLITSDEVVMAGGFGGTVGTNYWLYTNQYYWTMSPFDYDVRGWTSMFDVYVDGLLRADGVDSAYGVRPVINLNADIEFSGGNGKSDNPFVVKTNI